jgi:CheY-like chemotaxis protein
MTRSSGSEARHLVLVADDDRETREVFQEALEEAGYRVITAANGAVALSLLQDRPTPSLSSSSTCPCR